MSKAGAACMVLLQEATAPASSTQSAPRKAGLPVPSHLPGVNVLMPGISLCLLESQDVLLINHSFQQMSF